MNQLILNDENYYSNEANWQYMSVSQYKDFLNCESAALAKLKGDWLPESDPTALLVGNYVHSYFESYEAHKRFLKENAEKIYKKNGDERAEFKTAINMIEALECDEFFNFLYRGKKEVIVTGQLFGTEWKGKIDCLNMEESYFVDIKTTQQLDKRFWHKEFSQYVSFIEAYGYVLQMAVYKELLRQQYEQDFNPYIYAVTKESPPNFAAIEIDPIRYNYELRVLEEKLAHIIAIKNGEEKPIQCGKCEYCRKTKKVTGFIEIDDLLREV